MAMRLRIGTLVATLFATGVAGVGVPAASADSCPSCLPAAPAGAPRSGSSIDDSSARRLRDDASAPNRAPGENSQMAALLAGGLVLLGVLTVVPPAARRASRRRGPRS